MTEYSPEQVVGQLQAAGLRFGVVCSRFNEIFVDRLLDGAVDCLRRHGAAEDDITVVRTPGAFELPVATKAMAESGDYDAIIALGVIIEGETTHGEHIAVEVASGLARVSTDTGVPVQHGVLCVQNQDQAIARCGSKSGNRGFDAAMAAIETASLISQLKRN